MKSIQDEHEFFNSLFDMLNAHMGQNTELTLFDCGTGEPVITDIRNGHISNRHLGDTGNTNDACPLLKGQENLGTDRRFDHLSNGHILRRSDFVVQGMMAQRSESLKSIKISHKPLKLNVFSAVIICIESVIPAYAKLTSHLF
mgnify:CR=1 FL=1